MMYCMTVATKYLTFAEFLLKPLNGYMGFPDNATNTEAFLFPISVMKLNTCRVILTALYTAQFTLISIEPLF